MDQEETVTTEVCSMCISSCQGYKLIGILCTQRKPTRAEKVKAQEMAERFTKSPPCSQCRVPKDPGEGG